VVHAESKAQKIVTKSSHETEIVYIRLWRSPSLDLQFPSCSRLLSQRHTCYNRTR